MRWILVVLLFIAGIAVGLNLSTAHRNDKFLAREYAIYNELYFDGELPTDTIVRYGDPAAPLAMASTQFIDGRYVIIMDPRWGCTIWQASHCPRGSKPEAATMIHEMIHIKVGIVHQHDWWFRRERRRLIEAGAFDELL